MTTAEDVAAFKAGPTDAEVRHRFLTGRWPSPLELADLERRHRDHAALRRRPFCDVMHTLIGIADRRA
jgi:hypothetical protein